MITDALDCLAESRGRNWFQQVIQRASLKRVHRVFIKGRDKNHDWQRTRPQLFDHAKAIHSRHLNIEEEQIGLMLAHRGQSGGPIGAFANDYSILVGAKESSKSLPGQRFIINDQDAKFGHLYGKEWSHQQ